MTKNFVRQLQFREAFTWESEVEDFIKQKTTGYSLNVPCGKSQVGDVRLDINPNLSMRDAYDMFNKKLPYSISMRNFLRIAWKSAMAMSKRMKYGPTCAECGKPIKSNLLIDYCVECGKKVAP